MTNVVSDLSTFTEVPEKIIRKLMDAVGYIICQGVLEDTLSDQGITQVDFGFGNLYIKHENGEIKYKFVPSDQLASNVEGTVKNRLNLVENTLTTRLGEKLLEVYKELC